MVWHKWAKSFYSMFTKLAAKGVNLFTGQPVYIIKLESITPECVLASITGMVMSYGIGLKAQDLMRWPPL